MLCIVKRIMKEARHEFCKKKNNIDDGVVNGVSFAECGLGGDPRILFWLIILLLIWSVSG